jgi:hypothetical protein
MPYTWILAWSEGIGLR